jgi:hypothetical protein
MKSKNKIWRAGTGKCSVRTGLSLDDPANAKKCGQNTSACSTIHSCGSKRNTYKVRTGIAVFQTVCHDSKGESLKLCLGLFRSAAIGESPRQINASAINARLFLARFPPESS